MWGRGGGKGASICPARGLKRPHPHRRAIKKPSLTSTTTTTTTTTAAAAAAARLPQAPRDNDLAARVYAILETLKRRHTRDGAVAPGVSVVCGGGAGDGKGMRELYFLLVEDGVEGYQSYVDFLCLVHKTITEKLDAE